jgi:glyoxylate/hydroxypyruvate reductase A
LTPKTQGILNTETLSYLPIGAYIINSGRGLQIVEDDLLAALDSGRIAGAALDVFCKEPLPSSSPIWDHRKIIITPHIASLSSPQSAAQDIAENIRRIRRGETPNDLIDMNAGY